MTLAVSLINHEYMGAAKHGQRGALAPWICADRFLALWYTFFYLSEAVYPDPEICQKHVCGRGSAPDPARVAHDAPPDPLVGQGGGYPLPRLSSRRLRRLDLAPSALVTQRLNLAPMHEYVALSWYCYETLTIRMGNQEHRYSSWDFVLCALETKLITP